MAANEPVQHSTSEAARLVYELEQAEIYELSLRQLIVDVKDQLALGKVSNALSMLNEALNQIDNATDVVAPTREPSND